MVIDLVKFIHLLAVLALLGSVIHCLFFVTTDTFQTVYPRFKKLSVVAILTGTLLVHPKHFTFHTPWIIAAYTFLTLFILALWFLSRTSLNKLVTKGIFAALIVVLVLVIHDAVTKTTFL